MQVDSYFGTTESEWRPHVPLWDLFLLLSLAHKTYPCLFTRISVKCVYVKGFKGCSFSLWSWLLPQTRQKSKMTHCAQQFPSDNRQPLGRKNQSMDFVALLMNRIKWSCGKTLTIASNMPVRISVSGPVRIATVCLSPHYFSSHSLVNPPFLSTADCPPETFSLFACFLSHSTLFVPRPT